MKTSFESQEYSLLPQLVLQPDREDYELRPGRVLLPKERQPDSLPGFILIYRPSVFTQVFCSANWRNWLSSCQVAHQEVKEGRRYIQVSISFIFGPAYIGFLRTVFLRHAQDAGRRLGFTNFAAKLHGLVESGEMKGQQCLQISTHATSNFTYQEMPPNLRACLERGTFQVQVLEQKEEGGEVTVVWEAEIKPTVCCEGYARPNRQLETSPLQTPGTLPPRGADNARTIMLRPTRALRGPCGQSWFRKNPAGCSSKSNPGVFSLLIMSSYLSPCSVFFHMLYLR